MALPPWLDIKPTQTVESMESGFQIGQNWRNQKERIGVAKQELMMQAQRNRVQEEQMKMRLDMEATSAARKFQAQQQYQQLFQKLSAPAEQGGGGLPPDQAAMQATMQVGPSSLGETGAGTASIWREAARASQPFDPEVRDFGGGVRGFREGPQKWAMVPQEMVAKQLKDENGKPIDGFYSTPHGIVDTRKDDLAQQRAEATQKQARMGSLVQSAKMLSGALNQMLPNNPSYKRMQRELEDTMKELKAMRSGGEDESDAVEPSASNVRTYDPATKTFSH